MHYVVAVHSFSASFVRRCPLAERSSSWTVRPHRTEGIWGSQQSPPRISPSIKLMCVFILLVSAFWRTLRVLKMSGLADCLFCIYPSEPEDIEIGWHVWMGGFQLRVVCVQATQLTRMEGGGGVQGMGFVKRDTNWIKCNKHKITTNFWLCNSFN